MAKEYSNGEVIVTWQPEKCIHSGICVEGLSEVFQPKERPWIKIEAADTEAIVNQVKLCPSKALGYYFIEKNHENTGDESPIRGNSFSVEVVENGPLMVYGNIVIKYKDGKIETRNKTSAFCRCGASASKPFCDGSHKKQPFE